MRADRSLERGKVRRFDPEYEKGTFQKRSVSAGPWKMRGGPIRPEIIKGDLGATRQTKQGMGEGSLAIGQQTSQGLL
jgi:hypothetical protein